MENKLRGKIPFIAAVSALSMLVSANVALAAEVGNPIIVDKTNMFTADETVDLLGGDLGEAANFGLVGFDSIHLNAHTNSNIATEHAYIGAAFGNHANGVDEPDTPAGDKTTNTSKDDNDNKTVDANKTVQQDGQGLAVTGVTVGIIAIAAIMLAVVGVILSAIKRHEFNR